MQLTLREESLNQLRRWIEIEFVQQFGDTPFHRSDKPLSLHPGCHDLSQRLFQVFKGDILVLIHRGDIGNAVHPHHGREVIEKKPCFLCCLSAHIGSFKVQTCPVSPKKLFNGLSLLIYPVDLHAVEIRPVGADRHRSHFRNLTVNFHQILRLQGLELLIG